MDQNRKTVLCIFTLLLLCVSVSALDLDIVDKSYLQKNEFVITDQDGDVVANFTGDHSVSLPQGKSYFIDFKPAGLFDFGDNLPSDPFFLNTIAGFFLRDKMLAGLIALVGLLMMLGALSR
jgi:hypothetical protein